jgi:hypothetical protein
MGLFNATAFLKGAAQEGLNMFNKAEAIGEEGIENLKAAREEVNEEIKTMKDTYNKAIQIGDNVGGGAFAKYLFQAEGLNNLASYADLPLSDREEQLRLAKSNFEALSEEDKARFSDGDFSETVKADYDKEVEALKVNSGLVNTNNLGVATANTLGGKVQQMVDRQFEPRRQAIIDTVSGGELKESKPIEGGFEAIPVPTTGIQEYNFLTDPEVIDDIQTAYRAYKNTDAFLDELGNPSSMGYDEQVQNALIDYGYDRNDLSQNFDDIISNLSSELGLGPSTLKEQILFGNFMEKTYPNTYTYTGQFQLNNEIIAAIDSIAYDKSRTYQEKLNELIGFNLTEDQAINQLAKRNITG